MIDPSEVPKENVPIVPAYVERRENCPRYAFAGGVWIVLADRTQTSGNITNIESIYQRGGGLPRLLNQQESEMAYVISGRLRIRIGDEAEMTAEPGAMVFVPSGIARKFTADVDDTRVYHGFVPAGFEQLLKDHYEKTESMTAAIGDAPFDPATAAKFGIRVVDETVLSTLTCESL
jgi:quercetin dioxygenase-like cupin family protein